MNSFLIPALYGLSGLVGLAYEVLWVRMVTLQFGLSIFGVVITVAAFMAGLGLGALALSSRTFRRPLRLLALVEVSVALFSALLPFLAPLEEHALWAGFSHQGTLNWHLGLALVSFLLLTLPAAALGAGFPLVLSLGQQVSGRLGLLYGVNTLGAVLGALLPLILLPMFGWVHALRGIAALGAALGGGWWMLEHFEGIPSPVQEDESIRPTGKSGRTESMLLLFYGILGMASLSLEVAWTRLFGLLFLRTEYVLALILASFLVGIGLGSLVATRWQTTLRRFRSAFPWMAAGGILAGLAVLPVVATWVEHPLGQTLTQALLLQGLILTLLTFPVTFVLGLWLPLLSEEQGSPRTGVKLYGANSLGGALGALLTGFVWLPWLGTTGTLVWSAFLILGASLTWTRPWTLVQGGLMVGFMGLGAGLWTFPPTQKLLPETLAGSHDIYRYEDAVAMTQVVEQPDGQRILLTDLQRHDASSDPTAAFVQRNQGRLALLLQGHPQRVLFLGLGTGLSLAGSSAYPDVRREAVELSQGSIEAARRYFTPVDGPILSETELIQDDARHFMSFTENHYDVIVGDLYHPDLAGVGALLSLEQFGRVRDHLSAHGVFVQWLALNQFDPAALQVELRTFRRVFPDAYLFLDGMHLALVGFRQSWAGWSTVEAGQERLSSDQRVEATGGEGVMTWMGRYWGKIPDTPGPVQKEWAPVIDFSLPRLKYTGGALEMTLAALWHQRPSLEQAAQDLNLPESRSPEFAAAWHATQYLVQSWQDRMTGRDGEAERLVRLAFEANPRDRWVGYALADEVLAQLMRAPLPAAQKEAVLDKLALRFPWHVEVQRALWKIQGERHEFAEAEKTRLNLLREAPLDREAGMAKNENFQ
ncbi:fused MFS/spermidine synthase [Ferrovum sp.]|uniref:fused MFS/spermidine synthase n=1 Tax=Ferrovum sp. TaxID=2609467 RepID=UPI0026296082|nr:fused MFS/spermidine synthase [Ferrovum sp.]